MKKIFLLILLSLLAMQTFADTLTVEGDSTTKIEIAEPPAVHTFKDDTGVANFLQAINVKQALLQRIAVLKQIITENENNLKQLEIDIQRIFSVEPNRQYTLDKQNKKLYLK